mmetsp:Transcript_18834/g.29939  ORF Transcript_18834/g.29939 Transcript_18834/m.29939 type:complete len:467 (-) Transcript_18834:236-1636(-)
MKAARGSCLPSPLALLPTSLTLLFLFLSSLYSHAKPVDTNEPTCNFVKEICNSVENKIPLATGSLISAQTIEENLSNDDKRSFEHLLGHALRNTSAVHFISQTFVDVISQVMQKAAAITNGTQPDQSLLKAYGTGSRGNTGYSGPSLEAIKYALSANGNIREKWALIYILTKNRYFDDVMTPLAAQANKTGDMSVLESLGVNGSAVVQRYLDVYATKNVLDPSEKYSNGIIDFAFEPFNSWVRFDFDGPENTWKGVRNSKAGGCGTTDLFSNDPSIFPPLSRYELEYQCNSTHTACKLIWEPGLLCYDIVNTPFAAASASSSSAREIPGYLARADSLGYRHVAGPSGTTANVLQLAVLLGMGGEEALALLRLAMAAWMIPTDDHSFFEIMLGADSFLPPKFRLAMGMEDLGQLMPENLHIGNKVFLKTDVWGSVGQWLQRTDGKRLCSVMTPEARSYLSKLTGITC